MMIANKKINEPYCAQWAMNVLMFGLTIIFFLVPAGRFYFEIGSFSFSSGFNVYKTIPILFLFWGIWRWYNPAKPYVSSTITLPFMTLLAICVFSSLTSISPYQSFTETLELLIYFIFYLMLIDLPWGKRYFTWIGSGFVLGSWYLIYTGISQLTVANDMIWNVKLNGPFDYPNAMGVFCILCSGMLCWLASKSNVRWKTNVLIITMTIVLICGLLTQSRAVYLSLFGSLLVYISLSGKKMRWYASGIFIVVSVFTAILMFPKFMGMQSELQTQNEMSRLMIWTYLFENFLPGLPLFGYGLGPVIPERMADWLSSNRYTPYLSIPWHPHNLYLYMLTATGIPGLLAFLWWIKAALQSSFKLAQSDRSILCATLTGFLVYQCFEVHLLLGNIPVVLISLMAIGTVMPQAYFDGETPADD